MFHSFLRRVMSNVTAYSERSRSHATCRPKTAHFFGVPWALRTIDFPVINVFLRAALIGPPHVSKTDFEAHVTRLRWISRCKYLKYQRARANSDWSGSWTIPTIQRDRPPLSWGSNSNHIQVLM